jgi:hypothetical protein
MKVLGLTKNVGLPLMVCSTDRPSAATLQLPLPLAPSRRQSRRSMGAGSKAWALPLPSVTSTLPSGWGWMRCSPESPQPVPSGLSARLWTIASPFWKVEMVERL